MRPMLVPILLALSDMSVIAMFAYSTAASVSPPRLWSSDALNDVACSMYWFALMPAVLYAPAA